jgi:hypothetical protein
MGASASFETDGQIYKPMDCGCIFACDFYDRVADKVKLVKCCYTCMESLKQKRFHVARVVHLVKHTRGKSVDMLTRGGGGTKCRDDEGDNDHANAAKWLRKTSAIEMAHTQGIRSMDEFF